MTRPYVHVIHFICETLIFLYFSASIKTAGRPDGRRRIAAILFLILPSILYMENSIVSHVLLRSALRWGCFLCFLLLFRKGPVLLCGYYAFLSLTIFTANTNMFQTSLLFPISRGLIPFTGMALPDAMISSVIEYLFCFAMFFALTHLVELGRIADPSFRRFSVAIAVLACELYVKASLHAITESGQQIMREMSMYAIFLQVLMIILLIVYENYLYTRQIQEIAHLQEVSVQYQVEAYHRQVDHEKDTHRLYHDMKNHLLAIHSLCQEGVAQVQEYVDALIGTFMEISPPIVETGNVLLNGLIAQKGAQARAQQVNISVILDARPISYLSDTDICIIFGNALDNAIEACQNLPSEGERFIELKGGPVNGQYFLSFTNSFNGKLLLAEGQLFTMKQDKTMHGFGLHNIRKAVEQYGGMLCVDTQECQFKLTIMLPLDGTDCQAGD